MENNNLLAIPIVPSNSNATLALNMGRIVQAEQRGEEISMVTPAKAPELLATFNRAYLDRTHAFYEKHGATTIVIASMVKADSASWSGPLVSARWTKSKARP